MMKNLKVKSRHLQTKVLIPKTRNLWLAVPNSLSNTQNVKQKTLNMFEFIFSSGLTKSFLVDLEADISQLQAPTFTTINRGPPEPMLHLTWNLPVNLIGEKVLNPMIHCCDKCLKPILIYGRLVS